MHKNGDVGDGSLNLPAHYHIIQCLSIFHSYVKFPEGNLRVASGFRRGGGGEGGIVPFQVR